MGEGTDTGKARFAKVLLEYVETEINTRVKQGLFKADKKLEAASKELEDARARARALDGESEKKKSAVAAVERRLAEEVAARKRSEVTVASLQRSLVDSAAAVANTTAHVESLHFVASACEALGLVSAQSVRTVREVADKAVKNLEALEKYAVSVGAEKKEEAIKA